MNVVQFVYYIFGLTIFAFGAVDSLEVAGIYVGTSTGQVFYSRDAGDSWDLLADYLPPVLSVEAAVIA
jgi:hypothetical protein